MSARFPPCQECGRTFEKLFRYIQDSEIPTIEQNLNPNGPERNVQLPLSTIKEYQKHYAELSEFAAWVCGVSVEKFCLMDRMNFIGRVTGDHPLFGIDDDERDDK